MKKMVLSKGQLKNTWLDEKIEKDIESDYLEKGKKIKKI